MSAPLRVVLVGAAGYPGQNHTGAMYLPALRRRDDVEIVGLVATCEEDADFARGESLPLLDAETALAEVDGAVVCAPIDSRRAWIERVIEAGVPLLCDKPAAASAEDVEALAVLARDRGVAVTVAHHFRFHPMFAPTAASIARGAVGLPFSVQADLVIAGGVSQGREDLVNLGVHVVDLVRALLRGAEARAVSCHATDIGVVLSTGHANDVMSTIVLARTHDLAGVAPSAAVMHRYRVSGSHGTETVDLTKPGLRSLTSTGDYQRWIDGSSVDRLLSDWVAAVSAGRPGAVSLLDALAVARILDAACRSLTEGRPVPCDPGAALPGAPVVASAVDDAHPDPSDTTSPREETR
ncbi:Gfo/Idh/MocA family protein [Brachybacterium huguangmaarense]